jgi:SSS family solute:Na+ symporter
MMYAIIGLAFAAAYSLYGGLSAVAWTDVIQVIFWCWVVLVTTYLALNTVSDGAGMWEEWRWFIMPHRIVLMILDESNPEYMNLQDRVLVGGLWVANIYYWDSINILFKELWQNHCVKLKRNLVSC